MKQKYVWRARIVLLSAAGVGTMAIVRQVGKSKRAVWRERFVAEGVDGLLRDRPRSGRPPMVGPDQVRDVVGLYINPPDHALSVDEKSQIWSAPTAADRRPCGDAHA